MASANPLTTTPTPRPPPLPIRRRISTALTRVASSITAVNRNVTLSLAGKADANIHMWTGGCASHGHSGWQEYCLNQAHVYVVS